MLVLDRSLALGATLMAIVLPGSAISTPVVPMGASFVCRPIAVWDGDGPIWCAEGPKVRLAGIATREIDGSCRPGQPCPAASGTAARDQLVTLLGGARGKDREGHILVAGPPMRCLSAGSAKGGRTAAWCTLPNGVNLSCAMIANGSALRWASFDRNDRCAAKRPLWYR